MGSSLAAPGARAYLHESSWHGCCSLQPARKTWHFTKLDACVCAQVPVALPACTPKHLQHHAFTRTHTGAPCSGPTCTPTARDRLPTPHCQRSTSSTSTPSPCPATSSHPPSPPPSHTPCHWAPCPQSLPGWAHASAPPSHHSCRPHLVPQPPRSHPPHPQQQHTASMQPPLSQCSPRCWGSRSWQRPQRLHQRCHYHRHQCQQRSQRPATC